MAPFHAMIPIPEPEAYEAAWEMGSDLPVHMALPLWDELMASAVERHALSQAASVASVPPSTQATSGARSSRRAASEVHSWVGEVEDERVSDEDAEGEDDDEVEEVVSPPAGKGKARVTRTVVRRAKSTTDDDEDEVAPREVRGKGRKVVRESSSEGEDVVEVCVVCFGVCRWQYS